MCLCDDGTLSIFDESRVLVYELEQFRLIQLRCDGSRRCKGSSLCRQGSSWESRRCLKGEREWGRRGSGCIYSGCRSLPCVFAYSIVVQGPIAVGIQVGQSPSCEGLSVCGLPCSVPGAYERQSELRSTRYRVWTCTLLSR